MLLTQAETCMNLLTPGNKHIMHHADIETQKVVSTWSFQKDGVEVPMLDITHDNKSGQLENRWGAWGAGGGRVCVRGGHAGDKSG